MTQKKRTKKEIKKGRIDSNRSNHIFKYQSKSGDGFISTDEFLLVLVTYDD